MRVEVEWHERYAVDTPRIIPREDQHVEFKSKIVKTGHTADARRRNCSVSSRSVLVAGESDREIASESYSPSPTVCIIPPSMLPPDDDAG